MTHVLMRAITTLAFGAGLALAGLPAASAAPLTTTTPAATGSLHLVAGRHFSGGRHGGFRGGHHGGGIGAGIAGAVVGGLILGGIAHDYDDDDYSYGGYGYSCRSLEYRCDHGSEWACHRLDVDPNC